MGRNSKTNKLNIAIFTHNYPLNSYDRKDAGIFLYDFAHQLAKSHNVFIFCPSFPRKKEKYRIVPVTWFEWGGRGEKFGNWKMASPVSWINLIKLIYFGCRSSEKFAIKNKIDYILCAWAIPSGVFGWYVSKRLNVPYAVWGLGSDIHKYSKLPLLGLFIKSILKNADKLFANSYALIQKMSLISKRNVVFLPAITDFTKIKKIKFDLHVTNKQQYKLLYVGRLEKIKGPDVLIKAANILKNQKFNFVLNILGSGALEKSLKTEAQENGLENNVFFFGNANKEEVASYMENSDCLIVPSRNESLPLVILEAARMNLPFVATDVGDCKRIANDYQIGAISKSEDPIRLSKTIIKILPQVRRIKYKSKHNFAKLVNDFTQKKAVNAFLKEITS